MRLGTKTGGYDAYNNTQNSEGRDMDDLKELFGVVLIVGLGIVIVLAVISLATAPLEYMYCKEQAALNTLLDYEWLFWGGGCRVELPSGIWIDAYDIGEYQKHLLLEEVQ